MATQFLYLLLPRKALKAFMVMTVPRDWKSFDENSGNLLQNITHLIAQTPPFGSDGKESACNAGDLGSIPGLGRSPGGGHGSPLQSSSPENRTDRGAWRATVQGVAKSRTRLSD